MRKIILKGEWTIKDTEGEYNLKGYVPGDVFSSLVDANLMPHPYVGKNEYLFRKLEKKNWVYEKEFEIDDIDSKNVELVFEGIDTFSNIYVNDTYIGKTNDMFLEYRFDIKDKIKTGMNKIKVEIYSPTTEGKRLESIYGKLHHSGSCEVSFRPYVRKAQYSFGWDWGPRLPSAGIWKDVYIEFFEYARLYGSTAYILELDGPIYVEGYVHGDLSDTYVKIFMDGKYIGKCEIEKLSKERGRFKGVFKEKFKLWYPKGLGEQNLHEFEFVLLKDGKSEPLYIEKKKIGFRVVRIIKENDGEGESFIFSVNGEKIFAKGANWIPVDALLGWIKDEDYEKLIDYALEQNMNMLRLWGGGIFEKDKFYKLCDKKGIMIWHDFMFSCAEYPDHLDWFRYLVNDEVRQNVIRLRYHPSIVLWCGNNENNWAFEEWGFDTKVNGINLGNRLYLEDFPKICSEEDLSAFYWVSSPYGGDKANSQYAGDVHIWNIWSGWEDFRKYEYTKGKFISEFGFQSAPSIKTIQFVSREKDIFSDEMIHHNKQKEGMERIMKFINSEYGLVCDFEEIIYLSQIIQAEAIKTGVEYWRSRKYKTSGTLYWQLNDVWPVFSWSSIDYFKRKKALHFYAKRFYSDLLPILSHRKIFIVNDMRKTVKGILTVELWNMNGEIVSVRKMDVSVPKDSVVEVGDVSQDADIAHLVLETSEKIMENHKIMKKLKYMKFEDPKLEWEIDGASMKIKVEKPAIGVFVNNCEIEDNFMVLFPGYLKKIKCICKNRKNLSIKYLKSMKKD